MTAFSDIFVVQEETSRTVMGFVIRDTKSIRNINNVNIKYEQFMQYLNNKHYTRGYFLISGLNYVNVSEAVRCIINSYNVHLLSQSNARHSRAANNHETEHRRETEHTQDMQETEHTQDMQETHIETKQSVVKVRKHKFNSACGVIINGTIYTRDDLSNFVTAMIQYKTIADLHLVTIGDDKNDWYFQLTYKPNYISVSDTVFKIVELVRRLILGTYPKAQLKRDFKRSLKITPQEVSKMEKEVSKKEVPEKVKVVEKQVVPLKKRRVDYQMPKLLQKTLDAIDEHERLALQERLENHPADFSEGYTNALTQNYSVDFSAIYKSASAHADAFLASIINEKTF